MCIKVFSKWQLTSQRRDNVHFAQFQPDCKYSSTQRGQRVLIGIANLLDQAVLAQPFENTGDLRAGFQGKIVAQMTGQ